MIIGRKLAHAIVRLPRSRWAALIALLLGGVGLFFLFSAQTPHAGDSPGLIAGYSSGPSDPDGAEGGADEIRARDLYWATRRGLQFGVPARAYQAAVAQMQRLPAASQARRTRAAAVVPTASTWDFIGPQPMLGNMPNFGGFFSGPPLANSTGRVSAIAADPTTPGRLFVGAAGGGVWMSTDGGVSFAPIFDAEPTLAIGSIALDPSTTPATIFVGTGEGNSSADSYYGQGIFKSTNLGHDWTQLGAADFSRASFTKIAIDPKNPSNLFAAVTLGFTASRADAAVLETDTAVGLWRSTDGGDSWSHYAYTEFGCATPCEADDVVIDPSNPLLVFAAIDGHDIFRSPDGGDTWDAVSFPGVASGQMGRQSLAVSSSPIGAVYAMLGAPSAQKVRSYTGFFRSVDSGLTWSKQTVPSVNIAPFPQFLYLDGSGTLLTRTYSQSDYDQALAVAPDNADRVVFGGIAAYTSSDAGLTWNAIIGQVGTTAQVTHTDQHAVAVDPFNTNLVYVGNDGGFYSYDLSSGVWQQLNFAISAGQIQGIGPHPWDNSRLIAGFQDNGSQIYSGSQGWQVVETGDGGFALFDQVDPRFAYHDFASAESSTSGADISIAAAGPAAGPTPTPEPVPDRTTPHVSTSTDGGLTWNSAGPTSALNKAINSTGVTNFFAPLAADPDVPHRVFFGAHSVFVSTDGMFTWSRQTAQDLTGGCPGAGCALQDLEITSDHTRAWSLSLQSGTTPFEVFSTTQADHNSGATWDNVTVNLPFDFTKTQATGIATNQNNPQDAYLSISGFTASTGVGHLFRTTDFGLSWQRADGTPPLPATTALPDVPVLRALVDNQDITGNTVLAGTDIGVFRSTDGGSTWSQFGLAVIPKVPSFDLEQNYNGIIFAGTHGRGAYQLQRIAEFAPGAFQAVGSMSTARVFSTSTALANGDVLVVGGRIADFTAISGADLYDPDLTGFSATGSLQPTTDDEGAGRLGQSAALLLNGSVLIAGGQDKNFKILSSAEIYSPSTGSFSTTGSLGAPRTSGTATLLYNGQVLIAGGDNDSGQTASAELFDPVTGTFSPTGSMLVNRDGHTATLLRNGQVLITGGANGAILAEAELYDPATGTFLPTGAMTTTRVNHAATLMANGRVLITGGIDESEESLFSAEVYDPVTGLFSPTGNMTTARLAHTTTALDDGKVLIAGGSFDPSGNTVLASAELYDPASGTFSLTGSMKTARWFHNASRMRNQQILLSGGVDAAGDVTETAEVYEPEPPATAEIVPTPISGSTPAPTPSSPATGTPTPTSTPTLTPTPTPTSTPTPTPTETETPTPSPSATPTATSSPTSIPTPITTLTPTPGRTPTPTPTPLPGHPHITAVQNPVLAGAAFTINGSGFTKGSVVNLFVATPKGPVKEGPFDPDLTASSSTKLVVPVPSTITLGEGFVSVVVINTDQDFVNSNAGFALLEGSPAAGLPSITGINGHPLAATSLNPDFAVANVETTLSQGGSVVVNGNGFDTIHGAAVDVFCACPGGKLSTTFFKPGDTGLKPNSIIFSLPPTAPTGPGSIIVSNSDGGTFSAKSDAVSVPIGQAISVTSVTQAGSTITVKGTGFSTLTVINLFNAQGGGVVNLGGLGAGGTAKIRLTLAGSEQFTFTRPPAALAGAAYVQAINPPFVPFTSSGDGPGGAFSLK